MRLRTPHSVATAPQLTGPSAVALAEQGTAARARLGYFQLSTVNFQLSHHPLSFHNLAHSSTTAQKSPLCFHTLTNPFSCSSFIFTSIQIAGGYTPLARKNLELTLEPGPANSSPTNNSSGSGSATIRRRRSCAPWRAKHAHATQASPAAPGTATQAPAPCCAIISSFHGSRVWALLGAGVK